MPEKKLKLNITYIKILDCINTLNSLKAYPSIDGVKKILKGQLDKETIEFNDIDCFSSLISIKGRTLSSHIHLLVRYGFLNNIYNKSEDEYFLLVNEYGKSELEAYKKVRKINYVRKEIKFKKTILK